jgi:hypothetical protein
MGVGRATLGAGGVVLLSTVEPGGPVCAPVAGTRELGRRLARAVPGTPVPAPDGWAVEVLGPARDGEDEG